MSTSADPIAMRSAVGESRLELADGQMDLWLAHYDEIDDPALHAEYRSLLNAEERAQEPRFYFARDRCRYLVTRALVRTVLSRYLPVAPADWSFVTNEYGRPEIANAVVRHRGLSFNLSHTHSLVTLVVAQSMEVGVDVENVRAREVSLDIADRYFSPSEVADLARVPPAHQQHRFFEYWTFKESYIKARGMGLSLPLDKFSFGFPDDGAVGLAIDPTLGDSADRWELYQLRPRAQYLVAICAQRTPAAHAIRVREVVPLLGERALAPTIWRTSGSDQAVRGIQPMERRDESSDVSGSGLAKKRDGARSLRRST